MLQRLSSLIRRCLEEAAPAGARADEADDPIARRDLRLLKDSWNTLARSQDLTDRVECFLQNKQRLNQLHCRPMATATDGVGRDRNLAIAGRPLISIVEDDIGVRESLQRLIRSLGYGGSTFATAEDYLGSDLLCDTACLISDVQLPGMSGPDLQARLIADGYQIPIVFVTGFQSEDNRARALAAGAIGYFAKPFDVALLIDCVERALART